MKNVFVNINLTNFLRMIVVLLILSFSSSGCSLKNSHAEEEMVVTPTVLTSISEKLEYTPGQDELANELITNFGNADYSSRNNIIDSLVMMGSDAVNPLIAALQSNNSTQRIGAAQALGRIGDFRAVDPLIASLHDDFSLVRQAAATALGAIGSVDSVDPLIAVLQDNGSDAQEQAAKALGEIGDPRAVDPLIEVLDSEQPFVSENAIVALGKIGDPRAVEPLMQMLLQNKTVYRDSLKQALISIGAPAVEPLIETLQNTDPYLQEFAISALGEIKDPRAVSPLIAMLKESNNHIPVYKALVNIGEPSVVMLIETLQDGDIEAAGYAAKALGEIKDARAVEPLISALNNEDFYYRDWVATSLGQIGDPKAIEPLITSLKGYYAAIQDAAKEALVGFGAIAVEPLIASLTNNDPGVRKYSVLALGEIKDDRAVEPLIAALNDEDYYVRLEVPMVLAGFSDSRVVDPLIKTLEDKKWAQVRIKAVDALAALKDPRAVEPLIAALRDEDPYVVSQSASALATIHDERSIEPLLAILNNENEIIQIVVAKAISEFDDPRVTEALTLALNNEDLATIAGAYQFYIQRGESGSEAILIKALDQFGDKSMAEDFLNCRNSELKAAGEKWASLKGYSIVSGSFSSETPIWGSNP